MGTKAETVKQTNYDGVKWCLVVFVVCAGVYGNYFFSGESLLYRVMSLLILGVGAATVAFSTSSGRSFLELLKGAKAEIRRVVWPTKQETVQTTMLVVVVVILMGFVLWGVDSLLGWLVSTLMG